MRTISAGPASASQAEWWSGCIVTTGVTIPKRTSAATPVTRVLDGCVPRARRHAAVALAVETAGSVGLGLERSRHVHLRRAEGRVPARAAAALPDLDAHRGRQLTRRQLEVHTAALHLDLRVPRGARLERRLREAVRRPVLVGVLETDGA